MPLGHTTVCGKKIIPIILVSDLFSVPWKCYVILMNIHTNKTVYNFFLFGKRWHKYRYGYRTKGNSLEQSSM